MKRLILILALSLAPACASTPIANATRAAHISVVTVHAVVQAEANAFMAGAYDNAHHQKYVSALLKVTEAEKALNDALRAWNQFSGEPMPAIVAQAINTLTAILTDLSTLLPQSAPIASFLTATTQAIVALSGAK